MSTDQLINRAIHCLNTGQPNLAKLYIRKAHQQTSLRRQELKRDLRAAKYKQLEASGTPFGSAGARVADAMSDFAAAFTGIISSAGPRAQMRSSYALVAPSA